MATALVVQDRPLPWLDGRRGALGVGAVSGIFNVLAAASGPPTALFALQRGWSPIVTRATLQAFALPLNVVTMLLLGPASAELTGLGWAVGGLVVGTTGASLVAHLASSSLVRPITLTIAAFGGATLVVSGAWALWR